MKPYVNGVFSYAFVLRALQGRRITFRTSRSIPTEHIPVYRWIFKSAVYVRDGGRAVRRQVVFIKPEGAQQQQQRR